jgi:serine/threonine protein kinase
MDLETHAQGAAEAAAAAVHPPIPVKGFEYVLGDRIGSGAFGAVWEVLSPHTLDGTGPLCIKLEPASTHKSMLDLEYRIYRSVNADPTAAPWFPRVLDLIDTDDERCLVMEMGRGDLLDGGPYTGQRLLTLLIDAIRAVRALHKNGLLHRDVKPTNFVHHPRRRDGVLLIDMGLTKPFRDPCTNAHIPNRAKGGMVGTMRYASIHTLMNNESSRRCDMESLVYTWVVLFGLRLPWHALCKKKPRDRQDDRAWRAEVCACKRVTTPADVVQGAPQCLVRILRDVRTLGFEARPRYDAYIRYVEQDMADYVAGV